MLEFDVGLSIVVLLLGLTIFFNSLTPPDDDFIKKYELIEKSRILLFDKEIGLATECTYCISTSNLEKSKNILKLKEIKINEDPGITCIKRIAICDKKEVCILYVC
ncbi:MAG: hypothetical protein QW097_01715 [archaeon]